jgi:creatinine amidohydrolase
LKRSQANVYWGALLVFALALGWRLSVSNPFSERSFSFGEPRPIPLRDTVSLEQMTWMEVRDRIAAGSNRVIVPVGGIEQNGPYVSLEKHNLIVQAVAERAAQSLGDTIVGPLLPLSPEGGFSPPSGHLLYPGTISLRPETFLSLLNDVGESLLLHGIKRLYLIGDSGDAQAGLTLSATALNQKFPDTTAHVAEFYDYPSITKWIEEAGYAVNEGAFHDSLPFTLQLAYLDPASIRYEERKALGLLTLHGVLLEPFEQIRALGEKIVMRRAELLVASIRRIEKAR